MANLVRRCATSLLSSAHGLNNHLSPCQNGASQLAIRTIFTSPVLEHPTKKRRKRHPFFWLQDTYRKHYDENLTTPNEEFFQQFLRDKYSLNEGASPLKKEPWNTQAVFSESSKRTGLLAKKLGSFPMWTKNGRRYLASCLWVCDNHVIKYHSPEEYAQIGRPVDRKRYAGLGCIVVGAESTDPRVFTAEYNGLFEESAVMPKKKLTRFFISHDARIEPGTPLLASHFRPGMYVDVYGRSREQGLQGMRVRWRMKLGPRAHGVTKAHNRIGSIGRGRKWCGPLKGKKMPGHHGGERSLLTGLKVLRVDTKYNLIYTVGHNVPGGPGSYVNIMDSRTIKKMPSVENPPPFPTTSLEENSKLERELFHTEIHRPSDPTIVLEVSAEDRRAAALAAKRLGKAKTAQKIR